MEPDSAEGICRRTVEADGIDPRRLSVTDYFAIGISFLLPVAFSPSVYASFWTPKAAILLVVLAVGLVRLLDLVLAGDRASFLALGFVASAAVSTAASERPFLAVLGSYNFGTGLLFYASLATAWAIGRSLGARARQLALCAFLAALALSSVAAVAQTLVDLSELQLGRVHDRADAFMGNPVHLGAAAAGAIGGAAWYWVREGRRAALAAMLLFASAVQLSGSRFAVAVAVVTTGAIGRSWLRWRGLLAALVLVAGLGIGTFVSGLADAPSGTGRAATTVASGMTPRFEMWKVSVSAAAERPILGVGPGRFREGTAPLRTLAMGRAEGPDKIFHDAHNVVLEVAVSCGLIGLAFAVAWFVAAGWRATGPFAATAVALLSLTLVQPLSVSTVPLGLFMLGCAGPVRPPPAASLAKRLATSVLSAVAVGAAAVLLLGDGDRLNAFLDFDRTKAERSVVLLGFWPEPHQLLAEVALYESIVSAPDDPVLLHEAIRHQSSATAIDPSDPSLWNELGLLELRARDFDDAEDAFRRALEANPQSFNGWVGVGQSAMATKRYGDAVPAFERANSLAVTPEQRKFAAARLADARSARTAST